MSREVNLSVSKLLNSLNLEEIDKDRFSAHSPDYGRVRVFGGQFLGQAVAAAQMTVDDSRQIHSFHCYFVRSGDPQHQIEYQVLRIRDGASFSLRSVEGFQGGQLVFVAQVSFHRPKGGFSHQDNMPDVPPPEEIDFDAFLTSDAAESCAGLIEYMQKERPFDLKPTSTQRYLKSDEPEARQSIWLRLRRPMDAEITAQRSAAILAYASDTLFIDTSLIPHGVSIFEGVAHSISLDHSIWFHHPFIFDDWILFDMQSPISVDGRGLAEGAFYLRDGTRVASIVQEGLIRKRSNAQ